MEAYLRFLTKLAQEAGRVMLSHVHGSVIQVLKGDRTIVTAMDQDVHELVMRRISRIYPDHAILGEEGRKRGSSRFLFSVDETDGTVPALVGMSHFVFSIALLERLDSGNLVVRIAVVYNPTHGNMYYAVEGRGAYCNGKRISVNKRSLGTGTTIDIEWWPQAPLQFEGIPLAAHELARSTGTYCLTPGSTINGAMLVATGGFAGLVFTGGSEDKLPAVTASSLIVTEAGGRVSDLLREKPLDFNDFRYGALMTNGIVHPHLLNALRPSNLPRR